MKTVKSILDLATGYLEKHDVKRPRLVADTLLSHYLGLKRIELYMHFDRPLEEGELIPFRDAIKRAASFEPIDYILGVVDFFGCKIRVAPGVLIPRQETEILLDHICKKIDGSEKRALDLCTGCGCIAAALKTRYPDMAVVGVDLSDEALAIARENHSDVEWLKGDLTEPLQGQRFDLVVCNPPYVSEAEYPDLEPSVRDFEPKMALIGGKKGTEFYERLAEELPPILNPNAKIFFEIGAGQGQEVERIFSKGPWEDLCILQDWSGHDRFFILKVKENSSIMGTTHYV